MTENLPAVRVDTSQDLVNPTTDSWTAVLGSVVELARSICGTDFVPESIRNNVAATSAAIMYGREVGLPPLTALGSVHVIKGKTGMSAESLRALVLSKGHSIVFDETSSALCKVRGRRKGHDEWTKVTYTMEDAKQAGLTNNPNYTKNPRQMLIARASAELCRMVFADVIHGMVAIEELGDDTDTSTNGDTRSSKRSTVRRATRSTTQTDDGVGGPDPGAPTIASQPRETAHPGPVVVPLPGEPGYQTDDDGSAPHSTRSPDRDESDPSSSPSSDAADAPAASPPTDQPMLDLESNTSPSSPVTPAQQRKMHATFNDLGIDDRDDRIQVTSAIVGRDVATSNDLTAAEARTLLDALARCKTREHVDALVDMIRDNNGEGDE